MADRTDPEKRRAYQKRYQQEHKEELREYQRRYRDQHRDRIREQMRKNFEKNRERDYENHRRRAVEYRQEVLEFFGSRCVRCGFTDWRALQLDHINGDGHKERGRNVRDQHRRWKYVREHPEEALRTLQILCANCNWIKRYEKNENRGVKRTP